MRSSSVGAKIAIGAAVAALLVLIVYLRPSRQTHTEDQELSRRGGSEAAAPRGPLKTSERVQQRLDQLRTGHAIQPNEDMARMGAGGSPFRKSDRQADARKRPEVAAPLQGGADDADGEAQEGESFDEDPDDIPGLTSLALHDTDPERRLAAVTLLGSSEDPAVIPVLAQALSDEDEEVRMAALESLSDFTEEAPVEAIEKALSDSSSDIRFEALSVLADIGGEKARVSIEKALNDPDEEVRNLAEGILDLEDVYQDTPGPQEQAPENAPAEVPAGQPARP